ncbi:MAG TPA: DUF1924 domain-containing protein [Ramlibacter sp.]|nr:DUF1924 domain-containing protein [Ramlibacter sp.]
MSKFILTGLVLLSGAMLNPAQAQTPQAILQDYSAQAGGPPTPQRGRDLFTSTHGRQWSCSTCHGAVPVQPGKHAATGKPIAPLAPAFEPRRFSDAAKVEKWFGRNCNDVLGRPCSAAEKADVLAWLISLKP